MEFHFIHAKDNPLKQGHRNSAGPKESNLIDKLSKGDYMNWNGWRQDETGIQ